MGFWFDSLICDSDICKVGWPKQFGEHLLPLRSHPTLSTGSVKKEMWGLIDLEFPHLSKNVLWELCCALGILTDWYGGKGRGEEGFGYQQNRCQVFLGCPVSSFRSAKQLSSSSMITSSQSARVSPTVPVLLEVLGQKPRLWQPLKTRLNYPPQYAH